MMSIFGLCASGNFVVVNRTVLKQVGMTAAMMLAELADEEKFYEESGKLDNGWFFSTVQNIEDRTGIKKDQQLSGIRTLEKHGIIECEKRGMPVKRYFRLIPEGLQKMFESQPVGGKSAIQLAENPPVRITPFKNNKSKKKDIYTSADAEEVIAYLNEKTGKHFKPEGNNAKLIHAREKEGYTLDDFKKVIDIKVSEWGNDARMCRYLKPSTLFAPSHFDDYLNQLEPKSTTESADSLLQAVMERRKNRENRNNNENVINAQYSVHEEVEPDRDAESGGHMGDDVSGSTGRDRDSSFFAVSEDVPY